MVISPVSPTFQINTSHSGFLSFDISNPLDQELQTQIELPIPCSLHGFDFVVGIFSLDVIG